MIGSSMADQLKFPPNRTLGVLPWFRVQRRYHQFLKRRLPKLTKESTFSAFSTLLEVSALQELEIDYKLPGHVYSEESRSW